MWASSCARTAAKLASSGSTSTKPRLRTIVCPHTEGLERRREHYAYMYRWLQVEAVGDHQVVDDSLQHFIQLTFWSEQAGILQPLSHVVCRLLHPLALGFERRRILRHRTMVFHH